MAGEDIKGVTRDQWSEAAGGWVAEAEERERGPAGHAADRMLELAELRPGERVLELACGAGDVGLRAAEAVGPDGRVLCTDFADAMVDVVRERVAAGSVTNVQARVLDAEQSADLGERFDCALCRFGYMLMPNPAAALRGTREVLDEGGRVVLAVWGAAEENPWLSLMFGGIMKAVGAPPPEPGTPGPFALADHERLRELLTAAGFGDVVIEDVHSERPFDSVDDWWEASSDGSGPVSAIVRQLDDAKVQAVREFALAGAQRYADADGSVRFPATPVVARAAVRPR